MTTDERNEYHALMRLAQIVFTLRTFYTMGERLNFELSIGEHKWFAPTASNDNDNWRKS